MNASSRFAYVLAVVSIGFGWAAAANAQSKSPLPVAPGQALFNEHCAKCHVGPPVAERAPDLKTLMELTPETVLAAVITGNMVVPAQGLNDSEKRQIAEYLGGRPIDDKHTGDFASMGGHCAGNPHPLDQEIWPFWSGWGLGGNARFERSGFTAADVPRLKLKWAFGFPNGDTAYGQPAVAGTHVYVGSDIGYVYALNADTGCVYWSFHAHAGVRTAPLVVQTKKNDLEYPQTVYFADMRSNVYAVDAATGKQIWMQKLSDHYTSRITAAPAFFYGKLFVPISATEEAFSADPKYPCCTFRGSVVALDATTGKVVWRTYVIPETPQPTHKNSDGTQLMAPAGAAVWNTPTIDIKAHALYVGTGDAYTEPAAKNSDAVVAMDPDTGKILWSFQAVPRDSWMVGCVPAPSENCPKDLGVDWDFGSSPILTHDAAGRRLLIATPKSGTVFALDPDKDGKVIWKVDLALKPAPNNGEIAFGGAADDKRAYIPLEDGRFVAIDLATGQKAWDVTLESLDNLGAPTINGENRTKAGLRFGQSAAATLIPGAVFTCGWDGIVRALSTDDGKILWQFNTAQPFKTVNGVSAKGGSMGGPGPVVAGKMLYVSSGYANVGGGMPGNVLLAFSVK